MAREANEWYRGIGLKAVANGKLILSELPLIEGLMVAAALQCKIDAANPETRLNERVGRAIFLFIADAAKAARKVVFTEPEPGVVVTVDQVEQNIRAFDQVCSVVVIASNCLNNFMARILHQQEEDIVNRLLEYNSRIDMLHRVEHVSCSNSKLEELHISIQEIIKEVRSTSSAV